MRPVKCVAIAVAAGIFGLGTAARAGFTPGDLYIVQLGGTDSSAQSVSILDYSLSGATPNLIATHALPSSGPTALTLSGVGSHDGHLNFSTDGNYLLIGGYRANLGDPNPIAASSASVNRVVGRIDGNWNADTSTALTDAYSGGELDAVASVNGSQFWLGGDNAGPDATTGGLRYVSALGATTTVNLSQTQNTISTLQPDSVRNIRIINNRLYITTASQGSFGNRGLYATSTPLPTSGAQTMIPVMNNIEGGSGASGKGQELAADSTGKLVPKSDIAFADLNPSVPGFDTAYTTGGKADYEKWSLIPSSGGTGYTWLQVGAYAITGFADINALALSTDGQTVDLYLANAAGVYEFTDANGYVATQPTAAAGSFTIASGNPIITPDLNAQFRGIALASVPEPALLPLFASLGLILRRIRKTRSC